MQEIEEDGHFGLGQDDRQTLWPFRPHQIIEPGDLPAQDHAIQKEQCTESLILRRGAHVLAHCQIREELGNLRLTQIEWVLLAMEEDEAADPTDIGNLGGLAEMPHTDRVSHTLQGRGRIRLP